MFHTPFNMIIAGPTQCGKSFFLNKLLENRDKLIDRPVTKIVYCYGQFQPTFMEMQEKLPITFIKGIPNNLEEMFEISGSKMLIFDDLMDETSKSKDVCRLFTRFSHHMDTCIINVIQNIFHGGKELRNMSLNSHYLILFKSPRDMSQINWLSRQMCPGNSKFLIDAFNSATKRHHGYLVCDLKQNTPEELRFSSNIFDDEGYRTIYKAM